jgi:ATP-binding cassette subfamily C protein CydC
LFELIDAAPEVREPDEPTSISHPERSVAQSKDTDAIAQADFTIELRDVRFSYNPMKQSPSSGGIDPPALDGVSFSIPAGSRVAIVGPSGSGKSTIVNLLLRFWEYHEGQITLDGIDLHQYRADDVRELIGVVPQTVHLFNATLRDNLLLANPDATKEQIVTACQQAQLHDFIDSLPLKYETLIGENGLLLSGGERQRLAIARAILKDAPILILDEATANLDAITERQLLASLEPFMSGRTVIIISHRQTPIEQVDQVIEL